MSLLWTQAMAWYDDDRETDPEMSDYRDTRPYDERRQDLVEHISDSHDVTMRDADRALEKIENHIGYGHGRTINFGFASYSPLSSRYENSHSFRSNDLWRRAHVAQVPLKGMKASQSWVRPEGVAHNLFHPGTRAPIDEQVEGDPDYDPDWDEDSHRESDYWEARERKTWGDKPPPKTNLPRFLRHEDGSYTCLDGHHRVAADLILGKESIPGRVIHERQLRDLP